MNREQRLRRVMPGAPQDMIAELAARPVADVDQFISVARQARRDALEQDKAKRRQRTADRRRHGHVEDDQQAAATERQTLALARRAGSNLDTLARLSQHYADGHAVLALAVAGLREQGYSDGEIGGALGVSRAAVGQRFGRKGDLYAGRPGDVPNASLLGPPHFPDSHSDPTRALNIGEDL